MINYTYDGTFEGLLTAIAESVSTNEIPENIFKLENNQGELFAQQHHIKTNSEIAQNLLKQIRQRGELIAQTVIYIYLAELPNYEKDLLEYIRLALKHGNRINSNHGNQHVRNILRITQKVTFETHRLKGLVRFREMRDGTYYAPLEPDHNILQLLAPHFAKRLGNQKWLIHDLKRGIAVSYDKRKTTHGELQSNFNMQDFYAADEQKYQDLWQTFYDNIAIKERINPNLRSQFMPQRYWKYLVEV